MADILIRGMEMPKENEILVFDVWHGKVYARSTANTGARRYEVVSLPAGHGRLIDADALYEVAKTRSMGIYGPCDFQCVITGNDILKAHTIVPAEGGREG